MSIEEDATKLATALNAVGSVNDHRTFSTIWYAICVKLPVGKELREEVTRRLSPLSVGKVALIERIPLEGKDDQEWIDVTARTIETISWPSSRR